MRRHGWVRMQFFIQTGFISSIKMCVCMYKTKLVFCMFLQRFLCYFSFYIKQSLNKVNTNANLLTIWLFSRVTVWPRMLFFLAINNLNFCICLASYQVYELSELDPAVELQCKRVNPLFIHKSAFIRPRYGWNRKSPETAGMGNRFMCLQWPLKRP